MGQVSTPSAFEELLITKERKTSRSSHPRTALGNTLQKLDSMAPKKKSKKNLREQYNVEYTGSSLPSVLLRRNIQKTQTDGLANLLALQYVQTNPMVLFVRCKNMKEVYSHSTHTVDTKLGAICLLFFYSCSRRVEF